MPSTHPCVVKLRRATLPHLIRDGPDENLTSRVIEIPKSPERFELRDPKSSFVAYAPVDANGDQPPLVHICYRQTATTTLQ
jgi:hypothetical protein